MSDGAPPLLTRAQLEQWELFGAGWRLLELSPDHALVEMRACTGEAVEVRRTEDPALLERLRGERPG